MKFKYILVLAILIIATSTKAVAALRAEPEIVDLGTFLASEKKTAVFKIHNTGDTPVSILGASSDCGCLSSGMFSKEPIPPKEFVEIELPFDASKSQTFGTSANTATLWFDSEEMPSLKLQIVANVLTNVRYKPSKNLFLGKIKEGTNNVHTIELWPSNKKKKITVNNVAPGQMWIKTSYKEVSKNGLTGAVVSITIPDDRPVGFFQEFVMAQISVDEEPAELITMTFAGEIVSNIQVEPSFLVAKKPVEAGEAIGVVKVTIPEGKPINILKASVDGYTYANLKEEAAGRSYIISVMQQNGVKAGTYCETLNIFFDNPKAPLVKIPIYYTVNPDIWCEPSAVILYGDESVKVDVVAKFEKHNIRLAKTTPSTKAILISGSIPKAVRPKNLLGTITVKRDMAVSADDSVGYIDISPRPSSFGKIRLPVFFKGVQNKPKKYIPLTMWEKAGLYPPGTILKKESSEEKSKECTDTEGCNH